MNVDYDTRIIWSRGCYILHDLSNRLINIGHLHAGGKKMVLYINGKPACESYPTYNSEGVITAMSTCPPMEVKKGDKLSVSSEYNLVEHPL
jgi:hypothetical protein